MNRLKKFAPFCVPPTWSEEAEWAISPFVTSTTDPVFSFRNILPQQVLAALFSRASRAKGDLRKIFWNEYLKLMLYPNDDEPESISIAAELREIIKFHHEHPNPPYNTERAHKFFARWLSQYGDDSIAQLASANLVVTGLSQPAIKFIEDQRIGIAPLEKSTRYVDYGKKIGGRYLYYTNPRIEGWGLLKEYCEVMDGLFDTYAEYVPILTDRLQEKYPDEERNVLEKKSFDVLRGFLPTPTLSQLALQGNAQAFKYMIDRCAEHERGELRWFARAARVALDQDIPALLLRLDDDINHAYQKELSGRRRRVRSIVSRSLGDMQGCGVYTRPSVKLIEHDSAGEDKIITALLYEETGSSPSLSWDDIYREVRAWPESKKKQVLEAHFKGRTARWQKVGRAFENVFMRFEIVMNIGAYRDLHRHRMHTQARQRFTTAMGHEMPPEIREFGLVTVFRRNMSRVEKLFTKIYKHDPEVAQDVVTMFHFIRFYQFQNMRAFFWEVELRTIEQGHPDYRWVEQEKFRLIKNVYPLIAPYIRVNMNEYGLARRGDEERSKKKEERIIGSAKT